MNRDYMLKSRFQLELLEVGCDEAGRGCLAGPVFAAAVILPIDYQNEFLNDSKVLSEKKREQLREIIIQDALYYAVAKVEAAEIDKINIHNASYLAMHRAIDQLIVPPEYIIVDGNKFIPYKDIPYSCIVKGDAKYLSIAAASILAKTSRDDYMRSIHHEYPTYNWAKNKGYPTTEHRIEILKNGCTPHHRLSYKVTKPELK